MGEGLAFFPIRKKECERREKKKRKTKKDSYNFLFSI